jgi:hypothetical protein
MEALHGVYLQNQVTVTTRTDRNPPPAPTRFPSRTRFVGSERVAVRAA